MAQGQTSPRPAQMATATLVAEAAPFRGIETVRARAKSLAQRDYRTPDAQLPGFLAALDYDQYRDIRFRDERALWRDGKRNFQVQLFHPGFLYTQPVRVNEVEGGRARPVPFSPDFFRYGSLVKPGPVQGVEGFAGLKLNAPFNRPDHFDEVVSFLGASYFRALGEGNVYGLSARGLAIDTALPSGEEFPAFRELWVEKPAPGAKQVVVHALLDSPSLTGAYRIVVTPGVRTVTQIEATLYARRAVKQLGIAPLTSMYLFGENDRGSSEDFRPEVHDSDGLFVWMGTGEQLWRPLQNPERLSISSFQAQSPRAFGLLQRDEAFTSYEDLEARYDRRPSAWVEPVGDWGRGSVQLVEIPTPQEVHDNIVAAWVPEAPLAPGGELKLAYKIHWGFEPPWAPQAAHVVATRIAAGSPGARRFVIDFSPAPTPPGGEELEAVVSASRGQVLRPSVQPNPVTGGWRATFELVPDTSSDSPIELRCFLRSGPQTLSETWSYPWAP
ncbi:glucan biosynthesis protein [Aggregicoccus sp. 17bor-14]|nr:glucan biosynthesis protein [Simulacricoccus sp. 17bor-14]MRI86589.1 glucan biosynthesis protein [Aggregicoccus sp. 17bor-14]